MKWNIRTLALLIAVLVSLLVPSFAALAEDTDTPMLGGLIESPDGDYAQAQPRLSLDALPVYADNSDGLPPVAYQGRQSSCVGWSIAYYYRSYQEGREAMTRPLAASELFSPAFIYNQRTAQDRSKDVGMSMADGLRIAVEKGVASMATMPYKSNDWISQPSAEALAEAAQYKAESYYNIFRGGGNAKLDLIKSYLASGELVLLAVPIYSEFYKVRPGSAVIDTPKSGSAFYGGHAVTLVGYDDTTRTFKFVNSWGSWWGDKGFAYFSYDFIQQKAWEAWGLVDRDTTAPTLPTQAYELSGVSSGMAQDLVSAPAFAWQRPKESDATYLVYWGSDGQGQGDMIWQEDWYIPEPIAVAGHYYLRMKAQDAAGNETEWTTLFDLNYQPQHKFDSQALPMAPVAVRAR
jgi:hypothetical protein